MADIRIYVACHANTYVPDHPLLVPIQTGAQIAAERFEHKLHDDSGDNISGLNDSFCELTAQYWVWKNVHADYFGFFHDRRYLSFNEHRHLQAPARTCLTMGNIDAPALESLCLDEVSMRDVIENHDIVTMEPLYLGVEPQDLKEMTVLMQYKGGAQHGERDLDLVLDILRDRHPQYQDDAEHYLNSTRAYFFNMYIMRKDMFDAYCEWLFDILLEFDRRLDKKDYSTYETRKTGFVAERLFGIYLTHLRRVRRDVRIKELECAIFRNADDPYLKPAFDGNGTPVAMYADNARAPLAAVLVRSLVEHASAERNYDLVILDHGISSANKAILQQVVGGHPNVSLRFLNVLNVLQTWYPERAAHASECGYRHLIVMEYFRNYPQLVLLSVDVVLNADIAGVLSTDSEGYWLAAARDPVAAGHCKMRDHSMLAHIRDHIGLENPFDYFSTDVLVMHLAQLRKVVSSKAILELVEHSHNSSNLEQDLLNQVCKGHVRYLGQEWNWIVTASGGDAGDAPIAFAPKWLQEEYEHARLAPRLVNFADEGRRSYDAIAGSMARWLGDPAPLLTHVVSRLSEADTYIANARSRLDQIEPRVESANSRLDRLQELVSAQRIQLAWLGNSLEWKLRRSLRSLLSRLKLTRDDA